MRKLMVLMVLGMVLGGCGDWGEVEEVAADAGAGKPDVGVVCESVDETCDGLDNDCDGETDEGVKNACGQCGTVPQEVCDGADNDCDGRTDENLGTTTCGSGVCRHKVNNCVGGQTQACNPFEGAVAEVCDNADNDCDGETDESLGQTSCGQGICHHAVDNCVDGQTQACDPQQGAGEEVCNRLDDDCDGQVDEGLGITTCGQGICHHTVKNCVSGETKTCDPLDGAAVTEVCNGLDDNCDGRIDEGCDCLDGRTQPCGSDTGECQKGTMTCAGGAWGVCQGATGRSPELCDGLDNNCDGLTDEDLGTTTCGQGICHHTVPNCEGGEFQACAPFEGSVAEVCDNADNDCDGQTDESLGQTSCGQGICHHTVDNCVGGETQTCDPLQGAGIEFCNGLDDDCDGQTDEDFGSITCGQGICHHTVQNCANGQTQACSLYEGAVVESCDGLDNDCDGETDEGCDCRDGRTQPCGTDTGECIAGHQTCSGGVWGVCEGATGPSAEVCDGKDNDCNELIDEDLGATTCGQGICHHTVMNCKDGATQACEPFEGAVAEVCDGLDNDCDGQTDEGCPPPFSVTVEVEAPVSAEAHVFYADPEAPATDALDGYGFTPYLITLGQVEACTWGIEIAARVPSGSWPWYGCDVGAPSLTTLTVKVNGVVTQGVLTQHPWACGGGGEGNLAFSPALLGCP